MSERFSKTAKQKAVAEVILGLATMTKVAARYGMSVGYLSILCSRYRNSYNEAKKNKCRRDKKSSNKVCSKNSASLQSRVNILEAKVDILFQLINN